MSTLEDKDKKIVHNERKKLLKKAQQFVYPVGSSRHRIAIVSTVVFISFVVLFILVSAFLVYGLKSESKFTYQISKIIPFPIGKVDNNLVTYEEYMFELRYGLHYYVEQEGLDTNSTEAENKLGQLREEAETRAYQNAVAENIAERENIVVTDEEITQRIAILKTQASDFSVSDSDDPQGLGLEVSGGDQRFEEILAEYYDWDIKDLERRLYIQLVKSKLPPIIDETTQNDAKEIRQQVIANPKKFADLAKKNSDDTDSAESGGDLGFLNAEKSIAFPKEFLDTVNGLEDGQISEVIETDFGLHVIQRTETNKAGEPRASHILLEFRDTTVLLEEAMKSSKNSISRYVN